jgi:hypothetical protein
VVFFSLKVAKSNVCSSSTTTLKKKRKKKKTFFGRILKKKKRRKKKKEKKDERKKTHTTTTPTQKIFGHPQSPERVEEHYHLESLGYYYYSLSSLSLQFTAFHLLPLPRLPPRQHV